MSARKRQTAAQMRRAVDEWNAAHPVGTVVRYWPGARDGKCRPGTTVAEATVLGGHTAGVYVAPGGFVALTHVDAMAHGRWKWWPVSGDRKYIAHAWRVVAPRHAAALLADGWTVHPHIRAYGCPATRPVRLVAGDVVAHLPSGEEWVLGCDEVDGRVWPCGWPSTIADASDCRLLRRMPGERIRMLRQASVSGLGYAQDQLRKAEWAAEDFGGQTDGE